MPQEESNDAIFLDKHKISHAVLIKESQLISAYSEICRHLRTGYLKEDKLEDPNFECETYNISWELIHQIYSFLEFNKIRDYERNKNKELKKDIEILKEIMNKYENPISSIITKSDGSSKKNVQQIRLIDLKIAYRIIRKIISIAGYHDDKFQRNIMDEKPMSDFIKDDYTVDEE